MYRLESELKGDRRKKYLLYGGIGAAAIILLIIILAVSGGGGGNKPAPPGPEGPPRIFNPYVLYDIWTPDSYFSKTYIMSLNESLAKVGNYSVPFFGPNFTDSPLVTRADVRTSIVNNYNTIRF